MDLSDLMQAVVLLEFKLWDSIRNGCSEKAIETIRKEISILKLDIKSKTSFSIPGTAVIPKHVNLDFHFCIKRNLQ
jgi:hypothetical protein